MNNITIYFSFIIIPIKIICKKKYYFIHYIYHISDIHINCDKRHDEYKIIFDTFYKKIKNNSAVIITGNLLNSKSRITSKQIILARNFLFNISQKCPLIIIPGKLDKYENIMAIITNGNLPLNNIIDILNYATVFLICKN